MHVFKISKFFLSIQLKRLHNFGVQDSHFIEFVF